MSLINRLLVDLDKRQVRITDQTDLPPLEIKAFHVVPKNGHRFSRPVWLGIFSLVAILATSFLTWVKPLKETVIPTGGSVVKQDQPSNPPLATLTTSPPPPQASVMSPLIEEEETVTPGGVIVVPETVASPPPHAKTTPFLSFIGRKGEKPLGFSATPPQKAPDPPLPKQTPIVTAVPDPPVVSPVRRFNDKVPTVRLDNPVASPGALLPANKPSSMHVARATAGQPSPLQNPEVIPTLPTANRYVSRPSLKQSAPPQSQEIIPTLQTTQDNPDLSASKKVARATTGQSPSLENQETIPTLQTTQSLTWARTLLEDGQYEEAERVVRNQVAQSGESATALGILAILEQKRGNLETSNRYYNRLLRLEPDQYRWWLGLAVNKDQSGSKNEAVSFYRHVVKMNNVDDQVFRFAQERLRILEAKSAPER